jgi:three-Cys-motif partner protein
LSLFRTAEKHFEEKDIQTWLKHVLLSSYVNNWGQVFSRAAIAKDNINEVHYVDCFAGRGEFKDGTDGSPKLVIKDLFGLQQTFRKYQKNECKFHIHTVEKLEEYFRLLNKMKLDTPHPEQIHVNLGEFEEKVDSILSRTSGVPAFYFVDPFGYKGVKMSDVKKIINTKSHEILINVMSYAVVRNLTIEKNHDELCKFFGLDELPDDIKKYVELASNEKTEESKPLSQQLMKLEDNIIELYKRQIKQNKVGKAYTLSKRIHSEINPNLYFHLVFVTSRREGLKEMKDAMVTFDSLRDRIEQEYIEKHGIKNRSIFGDLFSDQTMFDTYDYDSFLSDFKKQFLGTETTYGKIIDYYLEHTPISFRDDHSGKGIYNYMKKLVSENKYIKTDNEGFSNMKNADHNKIIVKIEELFEQQELFL